MRKIRKYAMGMGVGAIGLGVMSGAAGQVGGSVAASGQAGMQKMAGAFPTLGTVTGAGLTFGALNKLKSSIPKRKKRKR